ncbi:hypothetical protein CLAFUW4_00158 [Fulvia fulva]|uniref:Heterokaryon incompatibility domain-containing protein n=1 Tax=Passalora fulva TaxID=5499 RepID=A0A9Q8P461_PASFU|nr:uncharacterized protein CLAFUR5_00156 [Fulvia fulva]KAK4634607.1 hypothetical protein CLAFUR4_00158 [Fulvia fulva]KAK4637517.1 hypothetical protein CLAFUR0_00156 [Fulvia fulva]UJO12524.1 hypothetical protein CLAFUR5_00156 [Fulvia fulva]WPV10132.1 hypothetical protein CLAFUW4_00158 [Fulvia fulva]WPV24085.1 hypothetical protein CLAFUW7_00158 [Fulvia fulva]
MPKPVSSTAEERGKGVEVKVKKMDGHVEDHGKHSTISAFAKHLRSTGQQLLQNVADGAGDVLIEMKGQVFDLTLLAKAQYTGTRHGLCSACSSMPFGQFQPGVVSILAAPSTDILHPLHKMSKHESSCRFCGLVCQALDREVNNPWDLLGEKRKMSHTSSMHRVESELPDINNATAAEPSTTAAVRDEERPRTLSQLDHELVANVAFLVRLQRHRVLGWVWIDIKNPNHKDSGLVIIEVWGFGRNTRTEMSRISHFQLRVSSTSTIAQEGPSLRYANRLNTKRVDLSAMKFSLSHCQEEHDKDGDECSAPLYTRRPRKGLAPGIRLIDVKHLQIVEHPHPQAQYACLSYTWGGFEALTLERANLAKFTMPGGLDADRAHLPRTLRAAIEITKDLGWGIFGLMRYASVSMTMQRTNSIRSGKWIRYMAMQW